MTSLNTKTYGLRFEVNGALQGLLPPVPAENHELPHFWSR